MRFLPLFFVCLFLPSTVQASIVQTPPLIQAVQSGHMPRIGQLIRGGTEINAINAWGRTATHYAVARNNQKALKLLLDHGADANLADNDGNTPLDMWHKHKNEEMLALLQAAGARPSFTKVEEQQPAIAPATNTAPSPENATKNSAQDLWQAAADNDRLSAERLLAAGADAKAENDAGKVPFDIAVEAEHYALAAILMKAAVGINGEDEKGWTPLMWAIAADEWDLVQDFIREGAYISSDRRQSAWEEAFSGGRRQSAYDIAKEMKREAKLLEVFIAEKGVDAVVGECGHTILMLAGMKGNPEIVKLSIDSGADINIRGGRRGFTALMRAAMLGHTEIVKILVNSGADINIKSYDNGTTALIEAAYKGDTELVKLLIDNGADINITNHNGTTALIAAAYKGDTELVKLLIDSGADINITNHDGTTALIVAAYRGDTELVKLLIDSGADQNIKDDFSNTALMFAARGGHTKIVELLINNKADLNIKSSHGNTALMLAANSGHTEAVKLIIDNKADLNIKNSNGNTALGIAEENRNQEIIDILRAAQNEQVVEEKTTPQG